MLPAFKQVLAAHAQTRLLLLGGSESLALSREESTRYLVQLQSLISELGLLELVHLTGYVSAETASHYLTGADIGVLPRDHGVRLSSSSLLTLLAHGLPTIATQPQTSLPSEYPVRLVPPHDIHALATMLLEMINHQDEHTHLGTVGRILGQSFTWQSVARRHLAVYSGCKDTQLLELM